MPNIGGVRCVWGGGEESYPLAFSRSTSFSNKFLPFLEMQDVPIFHRFIGKAKVLL